MKTFRYGGRGDGSDLRHGPILVAEIANVDIAHIDDPMSFPWQLIGDNIPSSPFVIDIANCDDDALVALAPALSFLTEHDTIINSTEPESPSIASFARVVGAGVYEQSEHSTREAKHMALSEERVLERARTEYRALAIDFAEVPVDQLSKWREHDESRPPAVAVRVPGSVIRAAHDGFAPFAQTLLAKTGYADVVGVWGIRPDAGRPLDRAIVVLSRDAR